MSLRWAIAVALVALVAAGLGTYTALRGGEHAGDPLARVSSNAAAVGPNGEPQVVAADPAVEFPAGLSELPNPPSHLAVDPRTGDLWFLIFTYDGKSNILYHYTPSDGNVETFDIPSSSGSELYSAIAIDSRGHVISAEGNAVTDFDPSSSNFTQLSLPAPATKAVVYSPADGPSILDMSLTSGGLAYLSRMNIPAITELDLSTGQARELPYPSTFGPAYDIQIAGGSLWMTSMWNFAGLSAAQTGRLDPRTDEFVVVGFGTTAIAAGPRGEVLGVRASSPEAPTPELVRVLPWGLEAVRVSSDADNAVVAFGLGIRDFIAVDLNSGAAWLAGQGSESLSRVDVSADAVRQFQLPVYKGYLSGCPHGVDCPSGNLGTAVRGLAVAPNGDLYFSDATLNRIGVIRAGR